MGQADHDDAATAVAGEGMVAMPDLRRVASDEGLPQRRSRGRRRMAFFMLAAGWGFFSGISAMLVALTVLGRPVHLVPPVGVALAVAGAATVGGALIVAAAYRETTRRRG